MDWLIAQDRALFEYLTLHVNPPWLSLLCEYIGRPSTYAIPILFLSLVYLFRDKQKFAFFLLATILLLTLSESTAHFLKSMFARPRPAVFWHIYVDPKALGFPSSHAANTMALAVFLSRWFSKPLAWFLFIPFIIGSSRVFANYHFPLDVFFGWLVGFCVAWCYGIFVSYLSRKLFHKNSFRCDST